MSSIILAFYLFFFIFPCAWGFEVPLTRSIRPTWKRAVSGEIGLGNNADLIYSVPVEFGKIATELHLDTGSSDLWVITDKCKGGSCDSSTATRYPSKQVKSSETYVEMLYGDSSTASSVSGEVTFDTVTIAGVAVTHQPFVAVDSTTNPTIRHGAAGIFGLGFPSGSEIQESLVEAKFGEMDDTDAFVENTYRYGPSLSRIAMSKELKEPMFSISLQRSTIDIGGGAGVLTVGRLPKDVDSKDLTWVPVRRYTPEEGGLEPPSFAPREVYPFRWEIDIEGVFLDGKRIADSTIPAKDGVNSRRTSALIDTGNSLLRGPSDVVKNIMKQVAKPDKTLPCAIPRTIAFQIGGKKFPIDPRDFIGLHLPNNAETCRADNLVATDEPSLGALFRWSLGDPFFKSNLVVFHYGNLTHPSVDPPRIGLLSMVPKDSDKALKDAVKDAVANGGNFETTRVLAPTAQAAANGQTTVVPQFVDWTPQPTGSSSRRIVTRSRTVPVETSNSVKAKENSAAHHHLGYLDHLFLLLLALLFTGYLA